MFFALKPTRTKGIYTYLKFLVKGLGVKRDKIMKSKFLKYALLSAACTFGSFANAGLIVDTADDSFIDATTGLEWMDFGINNHLSYNEVVAQMPTTYSQWRLATESEVVDLWHNAFFDDSDYTYEFLTGTLQTFYMALPDATGMSAFDDEFSAMSTNKGEIAIGWVADPTGGLSYAFFTSDGDIRAGVSDTPSRLGPFLNNDTRYRSTLLVRSAVPEPSTLAIFALGMIGLASRRFTEKS